MVKTRKKTAKKSRKKTTSERSLKEIMLSIQRDPEAMRQARKIANAN